MALRFRTDLVPVLFSPRGTDSPPFVKSIQATSHPRCRGFWEPRSDPSREPATVALDVAVAGPSRETATVASRATAPSQTTRAARGRPFGEAVPCGGQPPPVPVIPAGGGSSPPARKPPAGRLLAERSPPYHPTLSPKRSPVTGCPRGLIPGQPRPHASFSAVSSSKSLRFCGRPFPGPMRFCGPLRADSVAKRGVESVSEGL